MTDSIKVKLLREGAELPKYQTSGASGFDLKCCFKKEDSIIKGYDGNEYDILNRMASPSRAFIMLGPGQRVLIPTGLSMAIPVGYEGQVRSRSGLALKEGLIVLNAPGTIDSDYRGEIGVIICNTSNQTRTITQGDRIAQLVICKVERIPVWDQVEEFDETERGEGGFGSTGKQDFRPIRFRS